MPGRRRPRLSSLNRQLFLSPSHHLKFASIAAADELFALTDLFLPLRLLDLNELPVVERQKNHTKGHFRLDKIMIGEHSIQFNAIEKKTKQGYALELQPEDDDDKEWDIFGPAPTPRSASRKSKDGNPINYNESTIAINHTLTESFGGEIRGGI
jgi:hypothetical protein